MSPEEMRTQAKYRRESAKWYREQADQLDQEADRWDALASKDEKDPPTEEERVRRLLEGNIP